MPDIPVGKNLSVMNETQLLRLHGSIIDQLKARGVVRTRNNPVGDYTEWLVAKALDLELVTNSAAGCDGTDSNGMRYRIKGRRVTPENNSRQLSAIRNLKKKNFDYLAAVVFDKDYAILDAVIIPHELVEEYASYRKHVNAHILHLRGAILEDPRIKDFRGRINF
ncbi:MAG: hypothetical protein BECKG1743D_GA0114223_102376 [Candidatus Kentron sp. G]|nr:MAG: hypothetical protein BECKG1743F_GA0114225_102975 [Candidatus Kentron sp. G]VFM99585.1 MAG: hypothetical protein BECKG1743E_GA0114224_102666 [Candidatus Kentron sp. G]VFN00954.1 MAG: hypothetical protein BECKG1743D_GA0114223_102376 [Candidatus Kentron sp. G]